MQQNATPINKDLVLIGGGHAHVSVIKHFGMRPIPGVRITVISRDLLAPYSGMLPGYIAGHYSLEECHIDLLPLAQFAKARFIHDEVTGLDVDKKQVLCRNRPPIDYDVLSINIGSAPNTSLVQGSDQVVPVKPISHFVQRWHHLQERLLSQTGELEVAVVGGGAGGVELTLAMQYRLQQELKINNKTDLKLHFHLYDSNTELLRGHNQKVRAKLKKILNNRGVNLHLGESVVDVSDGTLTTKRGDKKRFSEVLWVTRASAQSWLTSTDLVLNPDGFISVDPTLQSVSHPGIFAAGDIADVMAHPRPKAGVFAVRQGLPLARNLRRALKQKSLVPFRPQLNFLSLISTGDQYALASKSQWMHAGPLMWRWKDWIDRRFMQRFTQLPPMNNEAEKVVHKKQSDENNDSADFSHARSIYYCAGCGSKVGKTILQKVLPSLKPISRDDVLVGIQQTDDAALIKVDGKKLLVQTVDHFRTFIDDPYIFGKICTNHALSDLFAMGAEPQTALAMATLNHGTETKLEQELKQLLGGVIDVLNQAGCALVGGHTNEGDELALGLSVNGLIDPDKVLSKKGLNPGDKLILTKSLGTGTLFAGHMRRQSQGPWIDNALQKMLQSNQAAAKIFLAHQASACTDVTGFGLVGHLLEMLTENNIGAQLHYKQVPYLLGADESLKQGIVSSIQPQNLEASQSISDADQFCQDWQYQLLFDPQTSGGLLAGVASNQAASCLQGLHDAGYVDALIVGEVLELTESQTIKLQLIN